MDELAASSAKREKNATKAMQRAEADAARHTSSVKKINALPPVKPGHQYEVIMEEQIEYVQKRHENQ
jgi:hypothetical protein